jgi:hypothetical protein
MGVNDDDEDPGLLAAFRKLETGGFSDLAARVKSIPRPLCKAATNPIKAVLSKSSSSSAVSASTTPVRQNGKFAKQGVASFFKRFSIGNIPKVKPVLKRVRGKQQPPKEFCMHWMWLANDLGDKYDWHMCRKAQDLFEAHYSKLNLQELHVSVPHEIRQQHARNEWHHATPSTKCRWLVAQVYPHEGVPAIAEEPLHVPGINQTEFECGHHKLLGALITYNGEWGQTDPEVQALCEGEFSSAHVTKMLKTLPLYAELGEQFFNSMVKIGMQLGCPRVSVSVEHSTKGNHGARVHLHAYISGSGVNPTVEAFLAKLWFQGRKPSHITPLLVQRWGKRETRACEGHYYLQYNKVGSIFRKSNYMRGSEFVLSRRWIAHALGQGKMDIETAMEEAIISRQGVMGAMREFEFQKKLATQRAQEAESARLSKLIASRMGKFKPPSNTVLQWKAQFEYTEESLPSRFKLLVLDGPTRMGKTSWALTFFGEENTLVLNCQNTMTPCMNEFQLNLDRYKCIMFEEGSCKLILQNKLLFQAGSKMVQIGQSPTQQYVQNVLVYGVPMIMTTNDFWEEVQDEKSRSCLAANIIYECVDLCYYP